MECSRCGEDNINNFEKSYFQDDENQHFECIECKNCNNLISIEEVKEIIWD